MLLDRQDRVNLIMIFVPILLILFLLLTPKEAIGCGFIGSIFGVQTVIENGACRATDLPWFFELLQKFCRRCRQRRLVGGVFCSASCCFSIPTCAPARASFSMRLAESGILISTLYLMFLAVSIIDFCLNFTGLSDFIAIDILGWMRSLDLGGEGLAPCAIRCFAHHHVRWPSCWAWACPPSRPTSMSRC